MRSIPWVILFFPTTINWNEFFSRDGGFAHRTLGSLLGLHPLLSNI